MMVNPFKPYTGFIRELVSYAFFWLYPKRIPDKKFILFTTGRTGSELLSSLLDSHPYIRCYPELLVKKVFFPTVYLKVMEKNNRDRVYGFKLNVYNFGVQSIRNPREFVSALIRDGYAVINLQRRNILHQAISRIYAIQRGKYHHRESQGRQEYTKIWITSEQLMSEMRFFAGQRRIESQVLEDRVYLPLWYEDHLLDPVQHQATVDVITAYLGIPSAPVSSDYLRTTPKDYGAFIENYDALIASLAGTEYANVTN